MAKEKTKKKVEKISEEDLKDLQTLINTINGIQFNIGKMEVQKVSAFDEIRKTKARISEMQELLLQKYGSYDVNVNDGRINWPKPKVETNGVEGSKKDEK